MVCLHPFMFLHLLCSLSAALQTCRNDLCMSSPAALQVPNAHSMLTWPLTGAHSPYETPAASKLKRVKYPIVRRIFSSSCCCLGLSRSPQFLTGGAGSQDNEDGLSVIFNDKSGRFIPAGATQNESAANQHQHLLYALTRTRSLRSAILRASSLVLAGLRAKSISTSLAGCSLLNIAASFDSGNSDSDRCGCKR